MSPFNLFEAIGATSAELRRSNFLAYLCRVQTQLLSPRVQHSEHGDDATNVAARPDE